MKPTPIALPPRVLELVYRHARAAFPAECCGWLAGPAGAPGAALTVDTVRPCANAQRPDAFVPGRTAETAYAIDGDDLIALSLSADGPSPARVIYHSHPNGRAYFSDTDRRVATSPWGDGPAFPVQHLVVGVTPDRIAEAALFAWSAEAGGFVEVARLPGAPL